tara:strand:- start:94 stop:501 length:408 start_codon:yes stop_codon:yes gene_type:complete
MKKLIILFGIAMAMQLASESDEVTHHVDEETLKKYEEYDKKRSAEAQRMLDEGYRDKDDYSGPSEEYASRQISGDVLVSDLTVSQLRGILKDVVKSSLRECQTTTSYATATASRNAIIFSQSDINTEKHSITCKF